MEEESRQRQSRMDKGEPYMSIQPAEDPDGKFWIMVGFLCISIGLIMLSPLYSTDLWHITYCPSTFTSVPLSRLR